MKKKAVVLLSGGLDSSTALYLARSRGYKTFCLIFDYGQRHRKEIRQAVRIAKRARSHYRIEKVRLSWKGSSLLDKSMPLPRHIGHGIPSTYVPARNTLFLAVALSYAEAIGAKAIYIGAHSQDYSGYPDCRKPFFRAFQEVVRQGTAWGKGIKVIVPFLHMTKYGIIKKGIKLGVPYELTWSCYAGGARPCGKCDSCYYRSKGFAKLGMKEPFKHGS